MKIAYISPGFGGTYYCQNCLRNFDLVKSLNKIGHETLIVPMYLPLNIEEASQIRFPVFYGALNVYLNSKIKFYSKLPNLIKNMFNFKPLLKWISTLKTSTDPQGMEDMTLSVMKGEQGKHTQELNQLIDWLKTELKPDIVHLSNALLVGIGSKIKQELGVPVFCTLQDEDTWIDQMEEKYKKEAYKVIEEESKNIDAYVSVSEYYRKKILARTQIDEDKIKVVPIGIQCERYQIFEPKNNPPKIGFLSRMSKDLGLDQLINVFIELKKKDKLKNLKLKISGGGSSFDYQNLKILKAKLKHKGFQDDVEFLPDVHKNDIQSFFKDLTLLCVPSTIDEAFGLFILESAASGIPVLMPDFGGYKEIVDALKNGYLYQQCESTDLVQKLEAALSSSCELNELSQNGVNNIKKYYSIEQMAEKLSVFYKKASS